MQTVAGMACVDHIYNTIYLLPLIHNVFEQQCSAAAVFQASLTF